MSSYQAPGLHHVEYRNRVGFDFSFLRLTSSTSIVYVCTALPGNVRWSLFGPSVYVGIAPTEIVFPDGMLNVALILARWPSPTQALTAVRSRRLCKTDDYGKFFRDPKK